MSNEEKFQGSAYCVRCKEKREFSGIVSLTGKDNTRRMARGQCPVCSTTVTRFLGKNDVTTV